MDSKKIVQKALHDASLETERLNQLRMIPPTPLDIDKLYSCGMKGFTDELTRQLGGKEGAMDSTQMMQAAAAISAGILLMAKQLRRAAFHDAGSHAEQAAVVGMANDLLNQHLHAMDTVVTGAADLAFEQAVRRLVKPRKSAG